jgi:hypothetical protein
MKELVNELITSLLTEEGGASKKYPGFFKKPGFNLYGKTVDGPATHRVDANTKTLVPISKKDKTPPKKAASGADKKPAVGAKSPSDSTTSKVSPSQLTATSANIPGSKGIMDAIVGVTEKGSAGAGTKESRAAEASVVVITNDLLQRRKAAGRTVDIDQFLRDNDAMITTMVMQLAEMPGSQINETWFNPIKRQVIGTISEIEKRYGPISEIVWDNQEGRNHFGIQKQEGSDRSDLYVKLANGEVVGVSLKKDGNVFLANQGYKKIMGIIARFAKSEKTKRKIEALQNLHKTESDAALQRIMDYGSVNKKQLKTLLSKLTRDDIKDVGSKDYDKFFTESGAIDPTVLDSALSGRTDGDKLKLLMKSLAAVAPKDEKLTSLLLELRKVDTAVTHKLIDLMNTDPDVNETVKMYMMDVLDMPQMLSGKPFPGVSRVVTVYGAGNVNDEGEGTALFVDGSTLRDTFGFSEGMSNEEIVKRLSDTFIIDAEADSRVGFIRLKTKNQTPPPVYFYPTIASLGVRARGLGAAGVFELYQQNAWTFTLASKSPNPEQWTPAQRKTHAKDTLKFLNRQLQNPSLSKSEMAEIQKDIEFYKGIK